MTGPPVAVAVVSWNTRTLLERCLASLRPDAEAGRAEVWVVDNASSDGSAETARAHDFARVVALDENVGFARAGELVAARTATPWIAWANADTAVSAGALEALLAAGAVHPEAGAIAPRLLLPDGDTQYSVHPFPSIRAFALDSLGLAGRAPRLAERWTLVSHWDPDRPRWVDWAVGAFLLVRRVALEQAGGFGDETQLYGEDLDLGWRLRRAGWRTWYEPSAVVRHEEAAATSRAWGNRRREELRIASAYRWIAARRGRLPAIAAGLLQAAGGLRVAALAAVGRSGASWRIGAGQARIHLVGLRRGLAEGRRR